MLQTVKEILRAWLIYAGYGLRGRLYKFSAEDVNLHWKERIWRLPEIKLLSEGELKIFDINGRAFYWPSGFDSNALQWLYNEVFCPRDSNPASYGHPEAHFGSGWVIDCGACEGFFTMLAFEKGARRVIAVEPLIGMKKALEKTFENEIKMGRFNLVSAALGKVTGEAAIEVFADKAYDARVSPASKGSARVPVRTIDSIVSEYGLDGEGFIKMDIEGAEMDALMGAGETLKNLKPNLAVAVYHGYKNAAECRDIVLSANPEYKIIFRGMYGWYSPPRPYMLFAY